MSWIHYIIITVIGFSVLIGLIRGFIREILSLITWICAFFISSHYYLYFADWFGDFDQESTRNCISVVLLFITILIIGEILNYLINLLINKIGLSGINKILGMFFGFLRGILIVFVILFFFNQVTSFDPFTNFPILQGLQSQFITKFHYVTKWIFDSVKNIPIFPPNDTIENIVNKG